MAPKKKASTIAKPELNDQPSRETSSVDLGFNFTGNIESDFPDFLVTLGVNPAPKVVMVKANREDEEDDGDAPHTKQQTKPKLFCFYREEAEGKNITQVITQVVAKNFLIGPSEAKALSRCLGGLSQLDSVSFIRTGLVSSVLSSISFPSSVRFLFIHLNPGDSSIWAAAVNKGVAHLCIQSNSIRGSDLGELGKAITNNETLLTLNINNNPIGDQGASEIVQSLLTNKRLASLSMSNCGIGDLAGSLLCRILSRRVEMTKEEIVDWRKKRMELIIASDSQLQIPQISQKQKRPGSDHSQPGRKSESRKGRKTTNEKVIEQKNKDKKRKSQTNMSNETKNNSTRTSPKEISVPDETGIERVDNKMFTTGNRTLYNLNLSRNKISFDQILQFVQLLEDHGRNENETKTQTTCLQQLTLAKNQPRWTFPDETKNAEIISEISGAMRNLEQNYPKYSDVIRGLELQTPSELNMSRQSLGRLVETTVDS